MSIEKRMEQLGIALPDPFVPPSTFVSTVAVGDLVFVSGHGPLHGGEIVQSGKVPSEISPEDAKTEARWTILNCLASLRLEIGSLDRVKRIVKILGMVNSDANFTGHPQVVNGASEALLEIFGESGKHARAAVGVQSLPGGISVEIEMIAEVHPLRASDQAGRGEK